MFLLRPATRTTVRMTTMADDLHHLCAATISRGTNRISLMSRIRVLTGARVDELFLVAQSAGEDNRQRCPYGRAPCSGLPGNRSGMTENSCASSGHGGLSHAARAIACGDAELVVFPRRRSDVARAVCCGEKRGAFVANKKLEAQHSGWRFINPPDASALRSRFHGRKQRHLAREHGIDSRLSGQRTLTQPTAHRARAGARWFGARRHCSANA